MTTLLITLTIIIFVYHAQKYNPLWAGLLAVIPVKIIATLLIAPSKPIMIESLRGVLIGQFFWGLVLLGIYLYWR